MKTNQFLFENSKKYIPGGVNSPVRSFNNVNSTPFFTKMAKDSYLIDIEGKSYIDYVCSWGANIIGHANEYVNDRIKEALNYGLSYGTASELEFEYATMVTRLLPFLDKIRLVNSGTEACMSAIRLARGYTKKDIVIKFNGCYHGHSDCLLVKGGSGLATFNSPSSKGIPHKITENTISIEFNNIEELNEVFLKYGTNIACVIIELVAGNMNFIPAKEEFVTLIRSLCDKHNSLLIIDEVMTGFRVKDGNAIKEYNVMPDLAIYAKVVGGGMPLSFFGGKKEIMDCLAPIGQVYQAGTLSGNPIAVTAGLATLEVIEQDPNFFINLDSISQKLSNGLTTLANKHGISLVSSNNGGMFGFAFMNNKPKCFEDLIHCDAYLFDKFFNKMLNRGVFFAPSMYEAGFISATHNNEIIDSTLHSVDLVFSELI